MSEQLPHIVPGQPRRSMYGEHNTHDDHIARTVAAFQMLADRFGTTFPPDWVERDPIRVVAEVGRRIES